VTTISELDVVATLCVNLEIFEQFTTCWSNNCFNSVYEIILHWCNRENKVSRLERTRVCFVSRPECQVVALGREIWLL